MNTMINKRGDCNIWRVHIAPITSSLIHVDTAEIATGCIRQLMSSMPTGCLSWARTSSRACQRASSTA